MKLIYSAPNRGHHYRYAEAFLKSGILYKFISGFSRFNPLSKSVDFKDKIYRADVLQNIYLVCLKLRLPEMISSTMAYLAKIEQDIAAKKIIEQVDIFIFYNGSGLYTCQLVKALDLHTICIVEAVNTHVSYQENILRFEYEKLGIPWLPFHKKEVERRIEEYSIADYILVPSTFVFNSFIEMGFSPKKLLKVPYGFNSFVKQERSVGSNKKNSKELVILYVGSISVRKGLRYLINAFKQLEYPNKRLRLVGPISSPSGIEDIAIDDELIFFTGALKGNALTREYENADIFCLPSLEEGLALVLGEAISFGLPIIATTNSGANDIITDGIEGFIVPIADENAIAKKLQDLVNDNELLKAMSLAAQKKARELNGWDETSVLLIDTVKTLNTIHVKSRE